MLWKISHRNNGAKKQSADSRFDSRYDVVSQDGSVNTQLVLRHWMHTIIAPAPLIINWYFVCSYRDRVLRGAPVDVQAGGLGMFNTKMLYQDSVLDNANYSMSNLPSTSTPSLTSSSLAGGAYAGSNYCI